MTDLNQTLATEDVRPCGLAVTAGCARPRAHFVRMFKPRFAALVSAGKKWQTVRPTPKRMPRAGDTISLRCWEGAPYRSKQRVLREATITRVATLEMHYSEADGMTWWDIALDGCALDSVEAGLFAHADGFSGVVEMARWFRDAHGLPFSGIVLYWHNAAVSHERSELAGPTG